MPLDTAAFRVEVRKGVGSVSTAEYADTDIDAQVTKSLRRFSQYCPVFAEVTLDLVADQSLYTVGDIAPTPSTAILAILKDSWSNEGLINRADTFIRSLGRVSFPIPPSRGLKGDPRSLAAAAMDSFLGRVESEMALDDLQKTMQMFGEQILVVPTPSASSTEHLLVALAHSAASFPDDQYHDELFDCARWLVGEELLSLRDKFKKVNVGGISRAEMDNAWLKKKVPEWEQKFKSKAKCIVVPMVPE